MLRLLSVVMLPSVALAQDAVFAGTVVGPIAEGSALVGKLVSGSFEVEVNGQTLTLDTTRVEEVGTVRKWMAVGDGVVLTFVVTASEGQTPTLDLDVLDEAWLSVDMMGRNGLVHRTTARIERLVARQVTQLAVTDLFDDGSDDELVFEPVAAVMRGQ